MFNFISPVSFDRTKLRLFLSLSFLLFLAAARVTGYVMFLVDEK